MDHLRSENGAGRLSRRSFIQSVSARFVSAAVLGSFPEDLLRGEGDRLEILPDAEPGYFSIRRGKTLLLERAFWRIETEGGMIESTGGRYRVTARGSGLFFSDNREVCDVEIRWRSEEEGALLVLGSTLFNTSGRELRVRNFFPIVTAKDAGGAFSFWSKGGKVLSDEWERCYGMAAVTDAPSAGEIKSAWDMHLFDPFNNVNCTLSYYEIPNNKLSFVLEPGHIGSSLTVRCDTHAGRRGVRVGNGNRFEVSEFMIRICRGSCFDALESYARLVARKNGVRPPDVIPMGWVDWYFSKAQTTEADVLQNLDFIARELKDFGMEYVQIDSGWQLGVETTPPPHNVIAGGPWVANSKFPRGMKWFAEEIKKRGLRPGIWVRPFHCVEGAKERTEHPAWFNAKGQMDFSHPEVQEYVRGLFKMLTEEWGYEYVKYDFPSFDLFDEWGPKLFGEHSAHGDLHHSEQTNMEAYRKSLSVIADATPDNARLLACNSIMPLTLGLADVYRIGDDVGDWGRTFQFGVKSVSARYYANGMYWANDPDCLLVRDPFTREQAQMWASLISLSGGAIFVSEHLAKLPVERLDIVKKTLPAFRNEGAEYPFGRPVDLLEHTPPEIWDFPVHRPFKSWHIVGLFNWSDSMSTKVLRFGSLGLNDSSRYHLVDFWNSRYLGRYRRTYSVELQPMSCQVLSLQEDIDMPQLLSTSRHILQGAAELIDVKWDSRKEVFAGVSRVIKNNPYEVMFFAGDRTVGRANNGDLIQSSEPGIARIRISAQETTNLKWTLELRSP